MVVWDNRGGTRRWAGGRDARNYQQQSTKPLAQGETMTGGGPPEDAIAWQPYTARLRQTLEVHCTAVRCRTELNLIIELNSLFFLDL